MASKYFIQKDGQTLGPMSASDVKTLAQSGRLMPNDLVWQEGSEKKVRAEEVKGLTFKSPQVVPPSPVQDEAPPPLPKKASPAGPIKNKSTKAYNTEQEGIIASMVESGAGVEEIAEAVGKTPASVRGKILSMGLKAPPKTTDPEPFPCGCVGTLLVIGVICIFYVMGWLGCSSHESGETKGWVLPSGQFVKYRATIEEVRAIIPLSEVGELDSLRTSAGRRTYMYQDKNSYKFLFDIQPRHYEDDPVYKQRLKVIMNPSMLRLKRNDAP